LFYASCVYNLVGASWSVYEIKLVVAFLFGEQTKKVMP
jgi:hypothetical protein